MRAEWRFASGAKVVAGLTVLLLAAPGCGREPERDVGGVFVGSTPAGEAIRRRLGIPAQGGTADPLMWQLTLHGDPSSGPASYELRIVNALERKGQWRVAPPERSQRGARVHELDGAVSLVEVGENLLHVLDEDRSLMQGDGGWSYTLNRVGSIEPPGAGPLAPGFDPPSYTLAPLASGASVKGVFEGRTPCQGISRALGLATHPGCIKAKWRLTLFQDPVTQAPTTYRIEGSLHWRQAREGRWAVERGTPARADAVVYQLEPSHGEAGLQLLEGDANVLFFLDADRRPMVGHAEFSYTLNRRE